MIKYKLSDIACIKNGKKVLNRYGEIPIYGSNGKIGFTNKANSVKNSIIIGRVGANAGSLFFSSQESWVSDNAMQLNTKRDKAEPLYLFYLLKQLDLNKMAHGSAQPLINQQILNTIKLDLPSLQKQKSISCKIALFDRKIQLNNQINANLDELMSEIFDHCIVKSRNFNTDFLSSIANYKNGLAMQKFRPQGINKGIPVLKIKELNQGFTDKSSDRCSSDIPSDVMVNTGDIIFSWSGTLLVKLWTGKRCGLNQHLFKVTSDKYPKWFIYKWTEYYLRRFQSIAAGKATTMGHIKRSDLKQAKVKIPSKETLSKLDQLISPLFHEYVNNIYEINELQEIKDLLLNKLL